LNCSGEREANLGPAGKTKAGPNAQGSQANEKEKKKTRNSHSFSKKRGGGGENLIPSIATPSKGKRWGRKKRRHAKASKPLNMTKQ